jgi:hypothetical protein
MYKKGRLSAKEKDDIRKLSERYTAEEISEKLNRDPETIAAWQKENMPPPNIAPAPVAPAAIKKDLKSSMAWKQLVKQFTPDEIAYFEERFVDLMSQFKDDVWATEQTQIFLLIKIEILMDRNMTQRRRAISDIEGYEEEFEATMSVPVEMRDEAEKARLLVLETMLTAARAAEANKTGEFVKLEEKHQALLRDLKSTRDQRLSKVENSRDTFLKIIKDMADNPGKYETEGKFMVMQNRVSEKEKVRLGTPHKFGDNLVDQPILTDETVALADEPEPEVESDDEAV